MVKFEYKKPSMEVSLFEEADIIRTSAEAPAESSGNDIVLPDDEF